ncbi:methyltransferase domain-containing protein [bacterium]|nr:methyltransferase domain-containing protein [bacterium]
MRQASEYKKNTSTFTRLLLNSKKNWVQVITSTLLVTAVIICLQNFYDLRFDFWLTQILQLNLSIISLILIGVWTQFYLQTLRCWVLFPRSIRPSIRDVLRIFSRGQVINLVFPMRSGDLLKIALLNDLNKDDKNRVIELTGTLTSDKLIDILCLITTLILFDSPLHQIMKDLPRPAPKALTAIGGLLCIALIITSRYSTLSWMSWIKNKGLQFLSGCSGLKNPKTFSISLVLGFMCWCTEALVLTKICAFFGFPLSMGAAILSLAILNLGISVPISIANIGVFETSLAFGLSQSSLPMEKGMIIAAIHHFFQIAGVGVWFMMSFFMRKQDHTVSVQQDFRVDTEAKGKALAYYHLISKSYDQRVRFGILSWFRNREKTMILSLAKLQKPAKNLIDVGCGGGYYSIHAKALGLHVTSVDAAPGMVEALQGKVDETYISDIEALSIPQKFDRVLCLGVLDFVLNPEKSLSNLCQLIAPGGRLVLFVPRAGWAGWIYRLEKKQLGVRVNLYRPKWIQAQLEQHGLILREIQYPLPTNMVLAFDRPLTEIHKVM